MYVYIYIYIYNFNEDEEQKAFNAEFLGGTAQEGDAPPHGRLAKRQSVFFAQTLGNEQLSLEQGMAGI